MIVQNILFDKCLGSKTNAGFQIPILNLYYIQTLSARQKHIYYKGRAGIW